MNVRFTGGGSQRELGRVDSPADCASFRDAWYYDDLAAPTKVMVCPDLCTEVQGGQAKEISIAFGCATKTPIPK